MLVKVMRKDSFGLIEFYSHKESPQVLIMSGMHGDEYMSAALLEEYLKGDADSLPGFIYIPRVSPSAVRAKTRKNGFGHDINRQFLPGTEDPEARSVMALLQPFSFGLCIDIHEDPDRTRGFYVYDTAQMTEAQLRSYRQTVEKTDSQLYTGVDDVDDEHLNLQVDRGYVTLGFEHTEPVSGFSSRWLFEEGVCLRTFTLEIPGKADKTAKIQLITHVIPFFLQEFSYYTIPI